MKIFSLVRLKEKTFFQREKKETKKKLKKEKRKKKETSYINFKYIYFFYILCITQYSKYPRAPVFIF